MDIGTITKVIRRLMLFRLTKFHFSPDPFPGPEEALFILARVIVEMRVYLIIRVRHFRGRFKCLGPFI